jgi:hypothetical protein
MSSDPETEQKILLCIDEVLNTFGRDGRKVVQGYLKKSSVLESDKILKEPELFCKKLSLVLGERGARVIELSIVQRLASNFELKNKKSELTLAEAIGLIRAAGGESCEKGVQDTEEY